MSASTLALPSALHFTAPPPGLEPRVEFTLAAIEGAAGLFSLTAADATARLFVLDAATHLPDYTPRPAPSDVERIGTDAPTVLVVVNPGTQSTVNLAAPILLNAESGACVQVILEGTAWPLRAPLAAA
ncbi:flagellar assembly protein FliW [Arthrobacter livingstonensis]|uniref:Flagellar assembly protein FliW n=1 Tax=Arthrobacter livingstonensis TaxID=670078 RepID=A0A2V5L8X2_9MICC|nr:flagellar assembly protein FliW [Arthrobacter livingstonensis]PYI66844.1 flagellar assembly protein FliW [Arthrobacter livingstonensis]